MKSAEDALILVKTRNALPSIKHVVTSRAAREAGLHPEKPRDRQRCK
jgi:hypothetical protein